MNVLILAAGYATRLYPETLHTPKALLKIGGRSMLDRLLASIDTLPEPRHVYLVTNHRFYQAFCAWRDTSGRSEVTIVDDGTDADGNKLGAIGDIRMVFERYANGEDWFIAASDNLFDFSLLELYDAFVAFGRRTTLCAIRVSDLEKLRGFAVATLDDAGRVVSLAEKPREPETDIGVFALYFYPESSLRRIEAYAASGGSMDSPGNYPAWLYRQEDVYCHIASGAIYDVGTPQELARLRETHGDGAPGQGNHEDAGRKA